MDYQKIKTIFDRLFDDLWLVLILYEYIDQPVYIFKKNIKQVLCTVGSTISHNGILMSYNKIKKESYFNDISSLVTFPEKYKSTIICLKKFKDILYFIMIVNYKKYICCIDNNTFKFTSSLDGDNHNDSINIYINEKYVITGNEYSAVNVYNRSTLFERQICTRQQKIYLRCFLSLCMDNDLYYSDIEFIGVMLNVLYVHTVNKMTPIKMNIAIENIICFNAHNDYMCIWHIENNDLKLCKTKNGFIFEDLIVRSDVSSVLFRDRYIKMNKMHENDDYYIFIMAYTKNIVIIYKHSNHHKVIYVEHKYTICFTSLDNTLNLHCTTSSRSYEIVKYSLGEFNITLSYVFTIPDDYDVYVDIA